MKSRKIGLPIESLQANGVSLLLDQPLVSLMLRFLGILLLSSLFACSTNTVTPEPENKPANGKSIAVYGASGKIGGLIVDEALRRGYQVFGVSRNPLALSITAPGFLAVGGDLTDRDSVMTLAKTVDAIIISVSGTGEGNLPETTVHAVGAEHMVSVLSELEQAPRVIQIGGASTMFGDADTMLENMPFRAKEGSPMHAMLFGHRVALDTYLASDINWTVVTPPVKILGWTPRKIKDPDTSMGAYRTSTTKLVVDADGENSIYVRDLAIATVDELDKANFVQQRFTVGY
ncbi:MAG: NAD(P)-dependent oxidoreductase [Pseudomonadales bacterium]